MPVISFCRRSVFDDFKVTFFFKCHTILFFIPSRITDVWTISTPFDIK